MQTFQPLALAVAAALSAGALADDSSFSVSGFGTVSAVRTNSDDAQYRASTRQPNGADKSTDFGVDTKLGVQLSGKLSNQFSLTAQLLSQKNQKDNFNPELEWAFAKFDATPDISIRGGRIGLPIFLISDYRNVGYANPWVRPPVDVYSQVAVSHFDGVDVLWKHGIGDATLTLQPYIGVADSKLPNNFNFKFKNLVGLNGTFETGSWLFRGGYITTKTTGSSPGLDLLVAGMYGVAANPALPAAIRAPWNQAAQSLEIKRKTASFAGIGATFDDGKWLFQTEYTQRRTKSFIDDTDGWYATLGYRFGNVMPYFSHANVKTHINHEADNLPAPAPSLAGLKAAVLDTRSGGDQSTSSLGVRWNAWKNVALKAQFDRVKTETGKDNFFAAAKPGFAGKSVNVYTIAADFVF